MSGRYHTIVADPPWPYADAGKGTGSALTKTIKRDGEIALGAQTTYQPMSVSEICALRPSVAGDAHLYLWTTNAFLVQAHEVAAAWGLWPRLPHSVKPDAFYDLVERASPGPYLEMFARRARFGWDYWGDQSLGTAELPEAAA